MTRDMGNLSTSCRRFCKGTAIDPDDLMQEVLLRFTEKCDQGVIQHYSPGLLPLMARNELVNQLRKPHLKRMSGIPLESVREPASAYPGFESEDCVRYISETMVSMRNRNFSEVAVMRSQGMSFKEIADLLGINVNTALGRMRYARMSLEAIKKEVG